MSALNISPEEFRSLATRVTGLAARFLAALPTLPSFPSVSGQQTQTRFAEPLPENGLKEAALEILEDVVAMSRPPSPRLYGYVLGSGDPVAALGDLLASILNQNVTAWRSSPAAVAIERQVIEGLAVAIGCNGFSGSLCSGASAANLMGLAMAREAKLPAAENGAQPAIVYASSEVHMSISKAVALLGLGRANLHLAVETFAFFEESMELSRRFRALKLWLSLRYHGAEASWAPEDRV